MVALSSKRARLRHEGLRRSKSAAFAATSLPKLMRRVNQHAAHFFIYDRFAAEDLPGESDFAP